MGKEKKNYGRMFDKCDFNFKKFEKMAEMMRSCCKGEGGMMDCCSMMRKMMMGGTGKEAGENNKEPEKTE